MLPALAGFAAKALLPSEKKINKDKLLPTKKEDANSSAQGNNKIVISKKTVSTSLLLSTPKEVVEPPKFSEIKNKKSSANDIFDGIKKTLSSIITLLNFRKTQQDVDKNTKRKNLNLESKKEKEEKLENVKRKGLQIKPKLPEDKFNIMRFFQNILIGSLVLAIFKRLEEIVNFFKGIYDQLKNFFIKLGEFFEPIFKGLKWIASGGANIIAKILGIPSDEADRNGLKKNIEEIAKKIPIINNLFKGIQDTIDSIRGYKEPSQDGQGGQGGVGVNDGGGVPLAGGARAGAYDIVSRIGVNREQWDTYRNTIAQIESGGRYDIAGGSGKYYDGRYQMGGEAKADAARILGIPNPGHSDNPNDPRRIAFRRNPELQERMFAAYTLANHGYLSSDRNYQSKQTVEQKLQVLAYAHNQGAGGASKWMRTGKVGKDGFGTSGTKYSNAIREAFKKSPSYRHQQRQQQADTTAQQAATQASQQMQQTVNQPPTSPQKTSQIQISSSQQINQVTKETPSIDQQISQAQLSSTQAPPSISQTVPQIMQQADYEVSGGGSSVVIPFSLQAGSKSSGSGSGRSSVMPIGLSKKETLNSYYQSQLIGFLYKQG